jgi:hypothetical protein
MNAAYAVELRVIRMYLRMRRAIRRRLPDEVGEIVSTFAHLNFLRLIPTIFALAAAPDHFFRRLNKLVNRKFLIFSSPVQTLIQLAAFLGFCRILGFIKVSQEHAVAGLLIFGYTAPIWSYLLVVIINYLTLFTEKVVTNDWFARSFGFAGAIIGLLFYAARVAMTPAWLDPALAMILKPRFFRILNWRRYLQAMLVFSAYSFLVLPICLLPASVFAVLIGLISLLSNTDIDHGILGLLFMITFLATILGTWISFSWLFVRPLSFLFLHCLKASGSASLRYETLRLQKLAEKAYFSRNPGISLLTASPSSIAGERGDEIRRGLCVLLARWKLTETQIAKRSVEEFRALLKQRREISEDLLQFRLFVDRNCDTALAEKLDRIESGLPLSGTIAVV